MVIALLLLVILTLVLYYSTRVMLNLSWVTKKQLLMLFGGIGLSAIASAAILYFITEIF